MAPWKQVFVRRPSQNSRSVDFLHHLQNSISPLDGRGRLLCIAPLIPSSTLTEEGAPNPNQSVPRGIPQKRAPKLKRA